MITCCHTSDIRLAKRMWLANGGEIVAVSGTGEVRYLHPHFPRPLRTNDRRSDVPGKLMTRINQLVRHLDASAVQNCHVHRRPDESTFERTTE